MFPLLIVSIRLSSNQQILLYTCIENLHYLTFRSSLIGWFLLLVPSGAALSWRKAQQELEGEGEVEAEGEREAGWLETRTVGATSNGLAHRWR